MQLRPYQTKAVNELRLKYANQKRAPLLVLPTGGGKTVVFTYVASNAVNKGNNVLILVHRVELLRQTSSALSNFGVKHGIINPKYNSDYTQLCQIASVQTVVKRLDLIQPDLIIVDEAHHAVAGTWKKIIKAFPNAKILGVTATPCRSDGKGLIDMFDSIVIGPNMSQLVEMGFLSEPIVYAPPCKVDLSKISIQMGDYAKTELVKAINKPTITGDAILHYKKFADGQPAIVFCISIEHAHEVADQFNSAGYIAESVDGSMSDVERSRIINGLGNGKIQVVTSCDLISEGTDIPAVSVAILLRPTQSEGLFLQQVGRALRVADGKKHAIILDHVGNCSRHGHPLQHRDWSLDAESRKLRKGDNVEPLIPIRTCVSCYAVFSPTDKCPQCGHAVEIKPNEIAKVDGDLVKMEIQLAKKVKRMEQGRAKTLDELKRIEKERGYKPGWAFKIFSLRQK